MPMYASGDQSTFHIGQRVHSQGCHGTVLFIGEVSSQMGDWIGVEWDDPSRGKHDGSYNGKQYFKTSHPTSGSLVRPNKLKTGCTCVEAIRTRYGKVEGSTGGVDANLLLELRRTCNAPFFDVVGFDHINEIQSDFKNLKIVILSHELVCSAGDPGQLHAMSPSIVELNLSHTLIGDWKALAEITQQLPHLNHLDISHNRLLLPSEEDILILQNAFKSIKHLSLGNVGYSWEEIIHCARLWPDVEVLMAQNNKIVTIDAPQQGLLRCLKVLSLQGNQLRSWEEVIKLGNLGRLEEINLGNTKLDRIFFPGAESTTLFLNLKTLWLVNNCLSDWNSINELNKLSSLENLFLQSNPIFEEKVEKAFEFTVAKIKGLKKLSGCEITNQERKGCEYDYMKHYGEAWLAAQQDSTLLKTFNSMHPRFAELITTHGTLEESDLPTKSAPLKSRMMSVTIFSTSDRKIPQFVKRVPKNMTIQKLSGLAQKLMNTGDKTPTLTAISAKAPDAKIPLDNLLQDLSYYSVEDGDSIAVQW